MTHPSDARTGSSAAALRTLPNGVRLLAVPMPHVQSVSVGIFLRVGSRDETPATNGIRHVQQDPTDEPASVLLARIRAERAAGDAAKPRGRKTRERT